MKNTNMKEKLSIYTVLIGFLSAMLLFTWPLSANAQDKIAFVSNRDGDFEIYGMNPDGSGQTRLTFNSFVIDFPTRVGRTGLRTWTATVSLRVERGSLGKFLALFIPAEAGFL